MELMNWTCWIFWGLASASRYRFFSFADGSILNGLLLIPAGRTIEMDGYEIFDRDG